MGGRGSSSGKAGSGGSGNGTRKQKSPTIETSSLPELQGSEAQIKWASQIRADYINTLNRALNEGHVGVEDIESAYNHSIFEGLGGVKKETRQQSDTEINSLIEKAKEAKKSAKADAKSQGKSSDEIIIAGIKAESSVCTPIYKKWAESDIKKVTKAGDWIEARRFNTLDVPTKTSLLSAIRRIEDAKKFRK